MVTRRKRRDVRQVRSLLLFRFGTLPCFSGAVIVKLCFLLLASVAGAA